MTNDRIYYSRNAEMHAMRAIAVSTLLCVTVGLGIGAVLALLFAPASGKQTRDELTKSVEEGLQEGREAVKPMVNRLEKGFDELQKNAESHIKNLK